MAKKESGKFFVRFLLLTIITFILVAFSFMSANAGAIGGFIGRVIAITNVLLLLYFTFLASYQLFKHLRDKEKEYFDFMYLVNLSFTFLITGAFSTFYIVVVISTTIV